MVAGDDGGRVQLETADGPHQLMDNLGRDRFRVWSAQPLAGDRQPPGMLDPDLTTQEERPVLALATPSASPHPRA